MEESFPFRALHFGATAIIRFKGERVVIGFEDPLATERVSLSRRTFPLAPDFTVLIAGTLTRTDPSRNCRSSEICSARKLLSALS